MTSFDIVLKFSRRLF